MFAELLKTWEFFDVNESLKYRAMYLECMVNLRLPDQTVTYKWALKLIAYMHVETSGENSLKIP